ncbi:hypothetical protein AWM75_06775 [Aerococcus urinaehominis]|uniref:Segregation and condensation protein A n=1 Tax=Aerococcus urinaehominis TaxID=128944 RepID=A0A0X8FLW3_9LACT|nr:segregation/condensation protein A [Aerococcus urinaehominis]AMB99704.1 hypothetical protein AWM75_06775 [Aerococcus urinaehominis]SDL91219.1 condensin subunit ScpA [Aerococcus urinaehominis]
MTNSQGSQDPTYIELAAFAGPLDLLMHLIKKHELDIFDIPIALITDQYLSYIEGLEAYNLENTGDYLLMAASLIAIKSQMLLPREELPAGDDESDHQDPRQPLVDQLLTYQRYQEASQVLDHLQADRALTYSKAAEDLSELQAKIPLAEDEIDLDDLFKALNKMVHRLQATKPLATRIVGDDFSIQAGMQVIIEGLAKNQGQAVTFSNLVLGLDPLSRDRIASVFLAMLELTKEQKIYFKQTSLKDDLYLYNIEGG